MVRILNVIPTIKDDKRYRLSTAVTNALPQCSISSVNNFDGSKTVSLKEGFDLILIQDDAYPVSFKKVFHSDNTCSWFYTFIGLTDGYISSTKVLSEKLVAFLDSTGSSYFTLQENSHTTRFVSDDFKPSFILPDLVFNKFPHSLVSVVLAVDNMTLVKEEISNLFVYTSEGSEVTTLTLNSVNYTTLLSNFNRSYLTTSGVFDKILAITLLVDSVGNCLIQYAK